MILDAEEELKNYSTHQISIASIATFVVVNMGKT